MIVDSYFGEWLLEVSCFCCVEDNGPSYWSSYRHIGQTTTVAALFDD